MTRDMQSLVSMNKEGIVSLPGYCVLSLSGTLMATTVRAMLEGPCLMAAQSISNVAKTAKAVLKLVATTILAAGFLGLASVWLEAMSEPACRRCVNLSYILWVCSLTLATLALFMAAQLLLRNGLQPVLATTVSGNMLPVFLAANAFTGLINLTLDTLETSDQAARILVLAYTMIICLLLGLVWPRQATAQAHA